MYPQYRMPRTSQGKKPNNANNVGPVDRIGTKKQEGSTIKMHGVQKTGQVENGTGSELSTSQLRPFHDTVLSKVLAGYKKGTVVGELFDERGFCSNIWSHALAIVYLRKARGGIIIFEAPYDS